MTFLYVTHDQEEALTMSDHVAVFNDGRIEQIGSPTEVYEHPATEFVAGFVGTSNILERDGRRFSVRPEKVRMLEGDEGEGEPGRIRDVVYVGAVTRYVVDARRRRGARRAASEPRDLVRRGARAAWQARTADVASAAHLRDRPTRYDPPARRKTIVRRTARSHVFALALVAALLVPAAGVSRGNGTSLPTKIGKGEGSLNLIEWAAYSDPSFAKPFEKQTGCIIHRKDAGSLERDGRADAFRRRWGGGQYDLVSASGDASLRLIYGGDVQPVEPSNLIPSWKNFLPSLQVAGAQHRRRACTTASRCSGARTRCSTTRRR